MASGARNAAAIADAFNDDGADTHPKRFVLGTPCDIFAIDASRSMCRTPPNQSTSPLAAALRGLARYMRAKILSGNSDRVGLILFGTREVSNHLGVRGSLVKFDLDLLDIQRILETERLSSEIGKSSHDDDIGVSDDYLFSDVLWVALDLFSTGTPRNAARRLIVVTDQQDPLSHNPNDRAATESRIQTLTSVHVFLDVIAIVQPPNTQFDFNLFYVPLFGLRPESDFAARTTGIDPDFTDLEEKMHVKMFKKRAAFRVPFYISDDLCVGIKGYYVVKEKRMMSTVKIDMRSDTEVDLDSSVKCMTTGRELLPTDIKYMYEFGGEKAIFTLEEMNKIRFPHKVGLYLHGFQDRIALKSKHTISESIFMVPDEERYTGSSSMLAHLLDRMAKRNKIAICTLVMTRMTPARIVALVPQTSGVDVFGHHVHEGFHAIVMPFVEDLRHVAYQREAPVPEEQAEAASIMVDLATNHAFDFSLFYNPTIARYSAMLEALALNRDTVEPVADPTEPNEADISATYGDAIYMLKEACMALGEDKCHAAEVKPKMDASKFGGRKRVADGPVSKAGGSNYGGRARAR